MIVCYQIPYKRDPSCKAGFYVFPDAERPTYSTRFAMAGPFETALAARMWILQTLEEKLAPAHAEVWKQFMVALGRPTHDLGLELYVIQRAAVGDAFEKLKKYLPAPRRSGDRRVVDRRLAASGEAA